MRHLLHVTVVVCGTLAVAGCGLVSDPVRFVLGTSTWAADRARINATTFSVTKPCRTCYADVLVAAKEQGLKVFREDEASYCVVLTAVPGCVDSTQAGVWFTATGDGRTEVSIGSPSEIAQERVSELIRAQLGAQESSDE